MILMIHILWVCEFNQLYSFPSLFKHDWIWIDDRGGRLKLFKKSKKIPEFAKGFYDKGHFICLDIWFLFDMELHFLSNILSDWSEEVSLFHQLVKLKILIIGWQLIYFVNYFIELIDELFACNINDRQELVCLVCLFLQKINCRG